MSAAAPTVCRHCRQVLVIVNGCVCCTYCDMTDYWPTTWPKKKKKAA